MFSNHHKQARVSIQLRKCWWKLCLIKLFVPAGNCFNKTGWYVLRSLIRLCCVHIVTQRFTSGRTYLYRNMIRYIISGSVLPGHNDVYMKLVMFCECKDAGRINNYLTLLFRTRHNIALPSLHHYTKCQKE